MSRQQRGGFWTNLFGTAPTHDRFSVEELQYLHGILLKNPVVTDANRDTVVEALRSIAELVIWGDQHDSSMVEYFLTENLLGHFNQILQQRSNRRGNVAMQVLQTLSILIQNLRNQQTVYYLFSNNHINEIVSMRFDFEDDEVLGYYVNLLKTISLKLNEVTVQFFFQAGGAAGSGGGRSPGSPARPSSFPLYSEAVKFVNHRDPMVRTAVKTLTLNVYAIPLPAVHDFVTSRPASAYFVELAAYITEQCRVLDRLLSSWDVASPGAQVSVEGCLAEVEDLLSYCNDVLMMGVAPLRELLLDCLWQAFVGPVLFWPLIQEDVAVQHIAALSLPSSDMPGGGEAARAVQRGCVGPLCSLYVFERLFLAITDQELLVQLVWALLGGSAASGSSNTSSPSSSRPGSPDQQRQVAVAAAPLRLRLPPALLIKLQYSPAAYRQALLGMLRGTDAQTAAAAVRVLAALLQSRAVGEEELEMVGLLPLRRRKHRQLLQALVGDSPANSLLLEAASGAAGPAVSAAQALQHGGLRALAHAEQQQHSSGPADGSMPACNGTPKSGEGDSRAGSLGSVAVAGADQVQLRLAPAAEGSVAVQLQLVPGQLQQQQADQQPPAAQHPRSQAQQQRAVIAAHADQQLDDIVSALLGLLASELLPPLSLHTVGWLLNRLLSVGKGGAQLSSSQSAALAMAVRRQQAALQQQLQGQWCDALAPMVAAEWQRCRQAILHSGLGSVHLAVQTWMQAVLVQELRWQQGAAGSGGPDPAAVAAKQALLTVQAAVATRQLQQALCEGSIPFDPPCPAFGEAEVRRSEVREQAQIALGASQRMSCTVCFSRGQERQAYFAVEGLPAHVKAGLAPDLSLLKPSVLQQLASAAPVCLVADPGTQPQTGLVLSVAPLMGAVPAVDARHARWLHVQVRPPLRGLLKVLATSHPGNALLNIQKHLISGHWVLSFPDGDRAASAAQHVEEWAHKMRAVYCQLLSPLLHDSKDLAGGSVSDSDSVRGSAARLVQPADREIDSAQDGAAAVSPPAGGEALQSATVLPVLSGSDDR